MTQIWITWLLLAGLIAFEVKNAFAELNKHKEAWKLAAHCVLLTVVGMLLVQAGLLILDMRYADRGIAERLSAMKTRMATSRPLVAKAPASAPHKTKKR